jgi:hypothetical protein
VHSWVRKCHTPQVLYILLRYFDLNPMVDVEGKNDNIYITFKFLTDDPEWNGTNYQKLVTFLKQRIGGLQVVWCVFDPPFLCREFLRLMF